MKCFLLYIDLLGFADMAVKNPRKVARVYSILDALNAHRHTSYRTIVFSDTMLVYNADPPSSDEDRNYLVWFLIEFAEDLNRSLTGQDVFFRGVLTEGDFDHYRLKNIECFFGGALVSAYLQEKRIPGIGLYIDNACNKHNEYFRTAPYDANVSYVYLNRQIEYLKDYFDSTGAIDNHHYEDIAPDFPWDVEYLRSIYHNMRRHSDPGVRAKFLATWDYYLQRYPEIVSALAAHNFDVSSLLGRTAWKEEVEAMTRSIKSYKRLGSGTKMSMQIGRSKVKV